MLDIYLNNFGNIPPTHIHKVKACLCARIPNQLSIEIQKDFNYLLVNNTFLVDCDSYFTCGVED